MKLWSNTTRNENKTLHPGWDVFCPLDLTLAAASSGLSSIDPNVCSSHS